MKIKYSLLLIIVLFTITSCSLSTNIGSKVDMYVSPSELTKKEIDLVSLFSGMRPYLFTYSISGNVKGANINFTDYSDAYNPKTETLFGFINHSGTLKGRIAISEGSNQIRIVSELDTGTASIHKTLESDGLATRILFLNKPHKIVIGESIPLAVILQSKNMKIKEINQVDEFIKNPKLFEQYDNSYVVTITFYDDKE